MKYTKIFVVFVCMTIGLSGLVKGQIYSSKDCFYAKAGSSTVSYIVKFEYSKDRVWLKTASSSNVRKNLAISEDFYEKEIWTDTGKGGSSAKVYKYYPSLSTTSKEVYRRESVVAIQQWDCGWCRFEACGRHGYRTAGYEYVAFSTDLSSFIKWYESSNNYSGKVTKQYYTRIPKEELLPKAVNYDFLDD